MEMTVAGKNRIVFITDAAFFAAQRPPCSSAGLFSRSQPPGASRRRSPACQLLQKLVATPGSGRGVRADGRNAGLEGWRGGATSAMHFSPHVGMSKMDTAGLEGSPPQLGRLRVADYA